MDFVTIANNHTMDFNDAGLEDTKAALDGIGMAYGEDEQAQVITTPSGIKMGIYTAGDGDSIGTGSTNIPDKDKALAAIADFESQGVDYIVCMFHWGSELKYRPTDAQVELAHACIDAGADLIYGSHSHCLQPLEEYNDGIILYSMGNWSFGGSTKPTDPGHRHLPAEDTPGRRRQHPQRQLRDHPLLRVQRPGGGRQQRGQLQRLQAHPPMSRAPRNTTGP